MRKNQQMRGFLHWQYSQFAIGILFAAGLTLALADKFYLAYAAFALCTCWSLFFWVFSDFLYKKAEKLERLSSSRNQRMASHNRKLKSWRWGISCLIALTGLALCGYTYSVQRQSALNSNSGLLEPANDKIQPNVCSGIGIHTEYFYVFLGNKVSAVRAFPHTVIALANGAPVLWLSRDSSGKIGVNLDIRESDERIVARIRDNKFELNPNHILSKTRPDFHTLIVRDDFGNDALTIRYMNVNSLSVTGYISRPEGDPIVISPASPNGICFYDNGVDLTM